MIAEAKHRLGKSGLAILARVAAAFALAALLSSCANVGPEDNKPTVSSVALPPAAPRPENAAPRNLPQVARNFGGAYESPDIERKLSSILAKLIPVSERPDLHYSITILNSPTVNAFALPDGQLFVTRGLLALANDEAEVAAVLAHEMSHVIARHASQRMEEAQKALLGSRVLSIVTGDRQLGQQALVAGALSLASFSRQQEIEADQLGIRNIHRAGFDPYGAARLLEDMDRYGSLRATAFRSPSDPPSSQNNFLATHPSTPERLALAIAGARQLAGPDIGNREHDAYLKIIDGMIYGDDPRTGLVRGRNFVHPGFGFAFTAPEGFTLDNTSRAVIGVDAEGKALRFDTIKVAPLTTLTEALISSATPELAIDHVEQLQINGFPAATALGRSPGWAFRFVLVRFGSDVYRFIFASKTITPEQDIEFLRTANSFRRLTVEEAAATKPYRIRIVTIGPGDTVESLAERMAGTERKVEAFVALNGIDRTVPLKPGMHVKIVAE